jgi:hypothetical protein
MAPLALSGTGSGVGYSRDRIRQRHTRRVETHQIGERSHDIYGPRYYGHLSSDPDKLSDPDISPVPGVQTRGQRTAAVKSFIHHIRPQIFRDGISQRRVYATRISPVGLVLDIV